MGQLNLHLTKEFEEELLKFMKERNILTKSAAIRLAIKEGLERNQLTGKKADISSWLGLATTVATNAHPRFQSDDDLWEK